MTGFEYLEIRACVEANGTTASFVGELEWVPEVCAEAATPRGSLEAAEIYRQRHGGSDVFWTIYGHSGGQAGAIGDFTSFVAAMDVLRGLIAPMQAAHDVLSGKDLTDAEETVLTRLEDFLNQCSNEHRL